MLSEIWQALETAPSYDIGLAWTDSTSESKTDDV